MDNEEILVFDEDACAEFIFKKLTNQGIAVSITDILTIMNHEYDYGISVGIYPPREESGQNYES